MKSFFRREIFKQNYLDFFAVVFLATVFADVFLGVAILLADVLFVDFFVEDVLSNEDAFFNKEEDLLLFALNC